VGGWSRNRLCYRVIIGAFHLQSSRTRRRVPQRIELPVSYITNPARTCDSLGSGQIDKLLVCPPIRVSKPRLQTIGD
jgi:hypothetical protein